jgi:uncharacterized protein (TIGR03437 family)
VRGFITGVFVATALAWGQGGVYFINTAAGSDWVGDGGPAILALLFQAEGLAADAGGNVYVADAADQRVRRIGVDGTIETIAGTGIAGFSGDGGPAVAAQLNSPYGLAFDASGNLYIADLGNARVRRVAPDGTIDTVASGVLNAPRNVAVDASGNVYISDFSAHRVYELAPGGTLTVIAGTGVAGYAGDGGPANAAQLAFPAGLALDSQGSLYIGDTQNHAIRKVTQGVITTFAPAPDATGLKFDASGKLYAANPSAGEILILGPAGATTAWNVMAYDIAAANGYWYASSGTTVMKTTGSGTVLLAAGGGDPAHGDGGPATQARLNHPSGAAMDSAGNLFIADRDNHRIRRVSVSSGVITTVAGTGVPGNLGDGGLAIFAELNSPNSVAVDASGNLYIADTGNSRVREVTSDGVIHAATNLGLVSPVYAIPDQVGNIYIADSAQGEILKAGSNGMPAVLLGGLKSPRGLALDSQGNLYFTESGGGRVGRMAVDGTVTAVPGSWSSPEGVAVDASGEIFVADSALGRVFRIDASGGVAPVAGTGAQGFSGDGGAAGLAQFSYPWDVAMGAGGTLAIADLENNRIRALTPQAQATSTVQPLAALAYAVNAASLLPGPIVPGSLALLVNTGIASSQLSGVQVKFGATSAQVLTLDSSGILILTPQNIAGISEIDVFYQSAQIASIPITVADSAPALFTDSSGEAAATNQDGSVNSATNPAPRGSVISLYGTGLGNPSSPVGITIGGYPAQVLYAGPTSNYPGLFQINALIPTGFLSPGNPPVVVTAGGAATQAGVTIWVN